MKRVIVLLMGFWAAWAVASRAQLVVDLKHGGASVRTKTAADYERERAGRSVRAARVDTMRYRDALGRAFSLLAADSLPAARVQFEEALTWWPDAPGNSVVRHHIGRIELAQGRYVEAVEQFSNVLRALPEEREVRRDRASAYLQLGHAREAVADCDILLARETEDSLRAHLLFMRAAAQMQLRNYADARQGLEKALSLNPGSEGAALLLIMALRAGGRPQEAMVRLNVFISSHPHHADALALRAEMEEQQGMYDAARYDLDAAIALEPDNAALYEARSRVLNRLGLPHAARRDARHAARLR